jgi:hypothetical protein
LGAPEGSLDAIPVLDSTPYTMVIVGDGEKTDKRYGTSTLPTLSVSKTFGDFGVSPGLTAITTDQQARDYIVQGIVDKHNVLSSNQGDVLSIALAICTDNANVGAATAYDIAAITAMTTDDNLIIGYNADASPVNMVLSVENKAAIIAVLTAANTKAGVLTASVLQYAMPTPLITAALGSTAIAGAAGVGLARADMIGILTVSIEEAYYDENYSNKRSLKIGLDPDSGFSGSVYVQESSMATVGSGQGVNIKQWHDNLNHYDQYTSGKSYDAVHISYPDDINTGGYYDVYSLYYGANRVATTGGVSVSPKRIVVSIPNFTIGDAGSNAFFTGVLNPQKTAFEAIMNSFVGTAGLPAVNI